MAVESGSRELERVTAFTDAAVAIALTLLALPLVDVAHDGAQVPLATLWREHADDVIAFVLSFLVISLFWRAHRRIFETADRIDEGLLSLNTVWLLGVVFLPVPTAVLTFGDDASSSAAVLYLANLCFVSLLNLALSAWVATHPALQRHQLGPTLRNHVRLGVTATLLTAAATGLAVPWGSGALLLLAALPLAQRMVGRHRS